MPDQDHAPAVETVMRPDHHGSGVKHPADPPKKKRGPLRSLARVCLLLLALVVLLIVLAPMLLSTGPGTSALVSILNANIDGRVEIDDLRLSWFNAQRVTGLRYIDEPAGLVAEVGELRGDEVGLFDLLTGSRKLGEVRVRNSHIVYTQAQAGPAPDEPGARRESDAGPLKLPVGFSGKLVIENLKVDYVPQGIEPVALSMAEGTLDIPALRDIRFDFEATLAQADRSGLVRLKGDALDLFDPHGVVQPMIARYQADATVGGLPIVALGRLLEGMQQNNPATRYLLGRRGRLAAVLGEGDLNASVQLDGTVNQLDADLVLETPNLHVNLYQERDGDTLIASPNSKARLDLTPDSFAALFPSSGLTLVEPTGLGLSRLEMRLPRAGNTFDWDAASASLVFRADDNFALRDPDGEIIGVDGLLIGGGAESIAGQIKFVAEAELTAVDAEGAVTREPVTMELILDDPLKPERQISFFSPDVPIKLIDALGGMDGNLVLWLGDMLEMSAELHGRVVTEADGTTRLEQAYALRPSGRVTGEATGVIDGNRQTIATSQKQPIEAELVPEAFAYLMGLMSGNPDKPLFTIDKPMPVYVTLRDDKRGEISYSASIREGKVPRLMPDPDKTYIGFVVELSPAQVYDPQRNNTYDLRGGTIEIELPDLRGALNIKAELDMWVRPDAGKDGAAALMTWQTTVTDLLDTEGAMPLDFAALMQQVALSGAVDLDHAPSDLFDSLLKRDGDVAAILGPVVEQLDASFTYEQGRPTGAMVRLNWDDAAGKPLEGAWASMRPAEFDIDESGMMTIAGGQDIMVEVKITEAFGNRWMGKLHPMLFDARSGDRPARLTIDGGSFRFPLSDPSMQGANVQAVVDLGSVQFGPDALLGRLLDWTGHAGDNAVFEPAQVSLVDGYISYEHFDLSVGNVKLRLDGEVDLVSGQIVDMAVRVPGSSLIRVFNELDGVIPPDDFLSIPMTGAIQRPQFDRELIANEVTRLLAANLIRRQEQNLRDRIREQIGVDEDEPEGELIDNALEMIFGRRRPAQQEQQPDQPQ